MSSAFSIRRRVPVVVLENVSFMLQLDKGAAMDRLAKAFEERGYRWAYRTVNSLAFLPQRRERVFFVASSVRSRSPTVLFADEAKPRLPKTRSIRTPMASTGPRERVDSAGRPMRCRR